MYFLGIDIGSSSVKVALLSVGEDGLASSVISRANVDYPTFYPFEGASEHNPDDWNKATLTAIKEAASVLDVEQKKRISGISFSSQAGSIYPADENKKPLYNALTWMDRRATEENKAVIERFGADTIRESAGWRPTPSDCVAKLLWLKRNEPEIFSKAKYFYTTLESVTGYLCGNFVSDATSIALTRLYDYKENGYNAELLEFLEINENMLPEILPAGSLAGKLSAEIAKECELCADIPVYVGVHDQYCASIGSGVTENGQLLIATGTAWVLFGVAENAISAPPYPAPCTHPIANRYGNMISLAGCGGALSAFATQNNRSAAAFDLEIEMDGVEVRREKIKDLFVCPLPPSPCDTAQGRCLQAA